MKRDIYQDITDRIIAQLEKGSPPWIKPWKDHATDGYMPYNAASKRPYHGINTAILWGAEYASQGWLTYKQAQELGGNVRKGEHGTQIVFWKFLDVADDSPDAEPGATKRIPMARAYTVFNVEQCDSVKIPSLPEPPEHKDGDVDRLAAENGATVRHQGNRAYFSPGEDYIAIPRSGQFETMEDYEIVLAHELTHWTGHSKRLDRKQRNRFGDESYAFEELVAEMGSAFISAHIGLEPKLAHHGAYLEGWLKVLRNDKRAIFTAASLAQAGAAWILERKGSTEERKAA